MLHTEGKHQEERQWSTLIGCAHGLHAHTITGIQLPKLAFGYLVINNHMIMHQ